MSPSEIIAILLIALAFGAWAFYAEYRLRSLAGQLAEADEKVKDAEIVSNVHLLSDDDLNAQMSDFLSRTDKP